MNLYFVRVYFDIAVWHWRRPKRGDYGWIWSAGPLLIQSRWYCEKYGN